MLRVRTFVDVSPIPRAGLGLIAAEDILPGTVIWEFTPGIDGVVPRSRIADGVQWDFLRRYGYSRDGVEFIVCADDARYINHSAEPNTAEDARGRTVAARLIRAGEEITEDYRSFEHPSRLREMAFIEAA